MEPELSELSKLIQKYYKITNDCIVTQYNLNCCEIIIYLKFNEFKEIKNMPGLEFCSLYRNKDLLQMRMLLPIPQIKTFINYWNIHLK